jgi:hypothetical protein
MFILSHNEFRNTAVDHDISSDGDVIIVLVNPSTSFAVPGRLDGISNNPRLTDSVIASISQFHFTEQDRQNEHNAIDVHKQTRSVSYRVPSDALYRISRYFKCIFSAPPWFEAEPFNSYGGIKIELHGKAWDPEALRVLLQLMHDDVDLKEDINLELLGKTVLIADYFECPKFLGFYLREWWKDAAKELQMCLILSTYTDILTDSLMRGVTICAFISLKLGLSDEFKNATRILVHNALRPINGLGLPFPPSIIGIFLTIEKLLEQQN